MSKAILSGLFLVFVVVASVIDARQRRFPNVLFAMLLVVSCAISFCSFGVARCLFHIAIALVVCTVLTVFELLWRRVRGSVGIGMGDIKALLCLSIVHPLLALSSFAYGLLCLALAGALFRRSTLPALPFICGAFVVLPNFFAF